MRPTTLTIADGSLSVPSDAKTICLFDIIDRKSWKIFSPDQKGNQMGVCIWIGLQMFTNMFLHKFVRQATPKTTFVVERDEAQSHW